MTERLQYSLIQVFQFPHLLFPCHIFSLHNAFPPASSSFFFFNHVTQSNSPLSPVIFVLYHIFILPSFICIFLPISLPFLLFSITPTEPSVLFRVQACVSISQCYLHVNSSSQIFTIVPGGEAFCQGWDDSPFVNTITPKKLCTTQKQTNVSNGLKVSKNMFGRLTYLTLENKFYKVNQGRKRST